LTHPRLRFGDLRTLCDDAQNAIFASELTLVEVSNAFARRQRRGEISSENPNAH